MDENDVVHFLHNLVSPSFLPPDHMTEVAMSVAAVTNPAVEGPPFGNFTSFRLGTRPITSSWGRPR